MRVRLSEGRLMPELVAFLQADGFLTVTRGPRELDVHLLHHVSDRHDRKLARAVLTRWQKLHPEAAVEEIA